MSESFSDHGIEIPSNARGNIKTQCPNCSQARSRAHVRERCLSVDVESGIWLCHHCQWSGKLKTDHPTPIRPNVRVPEPPVKPIPPEFTTIGERGLAWFLKRGIDAQTVQSFGIYTQTHYFPGAEEKLPAFCFPYTVAGELVNVKYRAATAKHFIMTKNARKTFFNLDAVRDTETVVVVEGEMDVLALAQAGIAQGISVPNGANSLTDEVMESARFLMENPNVRFVLAVDGDEPGRALEVELARRFGVARCSRVAWPQETKDANDVLVKHGADVLRAVIGSAQPYPIEGIITVTGEEQPYWTFYNEGLTPGLSTGWSAVNAVYTVRPGEFTVVTGEPGMGKSGWVDDLAVNMAEMHDWRIGVYSPENQPVARHIAMLAAKYVGKPFVPGPTERMNSEQAAGAFDWLKEHFSFLLPSAPTVDAVLELARILVYQRGIRGLILDPWNEIDHTRPAGLTETEHISQSLSRIRSFARQNGVHVWVVAHPTKLTKGADGKYSVATLYDVAGSAHWYNKADNGISVYRDKDEPGSPTTIFVQKIRFREVGQLGTAQLHYDPPTGRFLDLPGGGAMRKAGAQ
ncbi:MAG: toprim domain-containing protein [Chloroflexota bacterium]|nr:toprim domain-containing protein [Chloroflexota bacterium]